MPCSALLCPALPCSALPCCALRCAAPQRHAARVNAGQWARTSGPHKAAEEIVVLLNHHRGSDAARHDVYVYVCISRKSALGTTVEQGGDEGWGWEAC